MFGFLKPLLTGSMPAMIIGLVSGIGILWFSSEMVIRKIGPIAKFFGVKELVVTILGVSVLSSLPELTVSAIANAGGSPDISVANIIGSNFVTLTFVSAVCALIAPLVIKESIQERESVWMTLSTATILVLAVDGLLSRIDGVILIALYIPYMVAVVREAIEDSREAASAGEGRVRDPGIIPHFIICLVAIFGILLGADVTLQSGEGLGLRLGISELTLGALIFALGTSLPELAVAFAATMKKKAEVSIGEIYASNIFTALFVLGVVCLISPIPVAPNLLKFDIPFLLFAGIVIQIFITTGKKLIRIEAGVILILYIFFVLSHFLPLSLSF